MVIGNGMIAKSMSNIDSDKIIFFCSGVSNSKEQDAEEFDREKNLILKYSNTNNQFIYFSSYFLNFNNYVIDSKYYKHKLNMEEVIKNNFKKYLIFRLPQVVGNSNNPNTLMNHLFNNLINDKVITIYKNSKRNLLDVDDLIKFVKYAIDNNVFNNEIINIISTFNYDIEEIVKEFEIVLDRKAKKEIIDSNNNNFDILISSKCLNIFKVLGIDFNSEYLNKIINKYYS